MIWRQEEEYQDQAVECYRVEAEEQQAAEVEADDSRR